MNIGLYLFPFEKLQLLEKYLLRSRQIDAIGHFIAWLVREKETVLAVPWDAVQGSGAAFGSDGEPRPLEKPVLVSGGVFLLDRGDKTGYERGSALVPLLVRDFGSSARDRSRRLRANRGAGAGARSDEVRDVDQSRPLDEVLFRSDVETGPALPIVAGTDGKTGRLSTFDRRLPVAPLTTSVHFLAEILNGPLK